MPAKPLLKQYMRLTPSDFIEHPVWIGVHGRDDDQDWYGDTDEETFRPWDGALPARAEEGMLLVQAAFTFADGTIVPGYITPQPESEKPNFGIMQPTVFSPAGRHYFWGRPADEVKQAFYRAYGKSDGEIFPIRFTATAGLATGHSSGTLEGFYGIDKRKITVYR